MIEEKAYAKINLGLFIGKTRSDLYHDMKSLMVPIDIYDELTFDIIDSGIILVDNTNIKTEDNFVYKAAKLFKEKYNISDGVVIHLNKKVPHEAGLGGGSSDAAATLRGLNRLFNLNKSLDELATLAKELGSDMPFCVYQKPSLCTGRGEVVNVLDLELKETKFLIVKPPYGLSTKDVYQTFDETNITNHDEELKNLTTFLTTGDLGILKANIFNDLETPAFILKPELKDLKDSLTQKGYIVFMSGSGTALCLFKEDGNYEDIKQELKFYSCYESSFLKN